MKRKTFSRHAIFSLISILVWAPQLNAQDSGGCVATDRHENPVRQVLQCGETLRLEREPTAALRIFERGNDPAPRAIELKGGAILIDVTPGSKPTQIKTPHAIATVRGTTYVVDATQDRTSVFVIEGMVAVRKVTDASTVNLRAGDGVDVMPGERLEVRTWSDERAAALLARFGR